MKISVLIVTKNRYLDLLQCLGSLASQTISLDELIVIDNNSVDETRKIVKAFADHVSFKVKYVLDKSYGYPNIYNRALKEAKFDWVAIIDDDCVAQPNWLANIKKSIQLHQNMVAILGFSLTYYQSNIFSLTTWFIDQLWKERNTDKKNQILDLEILDNKNVVYHKAWLKKNNIKYDETRVKHFGGASEDCDLGMQIQQAGGKAYYDRNIIVSHKDPIGLIHYYKKLLYSTLAHRSYEAKWHTYRSDNYIHPQVKFRNFLFNCSDHIKLNYLDRIFLFIHVVISFLVVKLLKNTL